MAQPVQVAMLQDLEVPRADLERAFAERGLVPLWPPFAAPSAARAIATDGRGRVTAEDLDMHPQCRVLAVAFVGCNHVDKEACKRRGIAVLNCPDYSSSTVAELTIGLALSVYREIPAAERTLRGGGWEHSPGGLEVAGKSVGLVGLGHIGLETARLFAAFRPRELLGWSRSEKPQFAALGGRPASLREIFEKADIVCLSVLLTEETRGMVTRELLELLRPSCVLVNIARAGLVDCAAMVDLLGQRRFRAGLDVFAEEPLPPDDALHGIPSSQVVMVPHIGYKSAEALQRRLQLEAENLAAFFAGVQCNVVQPAAV